MLTLRKIFDNIIQHPNDDSYRQIELANKTFSSKVWKYPACEELMKMSGWVVEDDHVRLRDDSHVHIVFQLLESLCGQKDVNQPQTSSSDSSLKKYTVEQSEVNVLIAAVLNGNISDIKSMLKPHTISTAGRIYCEDGSSSVDLLRLVVFSQKIDVVELLVKEYSVDPYVTDDGGIPMVFVVLMKAPQNFCINFLKICGVKTSFKRAVDGTALLHFAVLTCCFQVVCFLVEECEADVNITKYNLHTPLHMAYSAGHTNIAEYLIQHGAKVMALDSSGRIPYDYIDGIPKVIALSQTMQNTRIIHQVPGSAEYIYLIKLCNIGFKIVEAVTLTMEKFPLLTEDGPTQPHYDVDHTSFAEELTRYFTKRPLSDQRWRALKSDQTKSLPYMF